MADIDIATMLTSIIALLLSVGGTIVLAMRGRAVEAIKLIAAILVDIGGLLVAITEAQADNTVEQKELDDIAARAKDIRTHINALMGVCGISKTI